MPETDRTRLIASATRRGLGRRVVNPPLERGSTLLSDRAEDMRDASLGPVYGLDGLAPQRALADALAEMEGACRTLLAPSGLSALTTPLLALTRAGDEVVASDAIYGPSRRFLTRFLATRGVTTRFHAPGASPEEIAGFIGPATRLILIESPASLTFEMMDVAALSAVARERGALTVMDNTWAAGLAFKPLQHGVDVSVQAVTKYVAGHSDVLLGAMSVADPTIARALANAVEDLGLHVSPDDAWLALRGLRTLPVRLQAHEKAALRVAEWLERRPEVARVLYPPLPGSEGHPLWSRDYSGAAGLMGVVMRDWDEARAQAFMNRLTLFGLGYSWGGFESLITHETGQLSLRARPPRLEGALLRLHVGLEDPHDLIADLSRAFTE
ncbi:cystathionine beta-lyase [Brevundimonas balnearis]|uniref:Cystathionine beta-lyase n=1 Tax=Brevundimonas balnearis TaxID=1572858 RepID=A0ABV6R0N5_9CAUL